jgi:hypothetical protein
MTLTHIVFFLVRIYDKNSDRLTVLALSKKMKFLWHLQCEHKIPKTIHHENIFHVFLEDYLKKKTWPINL